MTINISSVARKEYHDAAAGNGSSYEAVRLVDNLKNYSKLS